MQRQRARPGEVGTQTAPVPRSLVQAGRRLCSLWLPFLTADRSPFLECWCGESLEPFGTGQWGREWTDPHPVVLEGGTVWHGPQWGGHSALRQPQARAGLPRVGCLPVAKAQGARACCLVLWLPGGGTRLPRQRCVQEAGPPDTWRPQEAVETCEGRPCTKRFPSCPRSDRAPS